MRWLPLVVLLSCSRWKHSDRDDDDDDRGDDSGAVDPNDSDGDGYAANSSGGSDCDDSDPDINPGADEIWYDGVDQDCHGDSDFDADQDGFDSDLYGGTDCDDTVNTINPLGLELCDSGEDEDCDALVDEGPCGWDSSHALGTWHDPDLQWLGEAIAADCDLDGDGQLEVLVSAVGDPDVDVPGVVLTASDGSSPIRPSLPIPKPQVERSVLHYPTRDM